MLRLMDAGTIQQTRRHDGLSIEWTMNHYGATYRIEAPSSSPKFCQTT